MTYNFPARLICALLAWPIGVILIAGIVIAIAFSPILVLIPGVRVNIGEKEI